MRLLNVVVVLLRMVISFIKCSLANIVSDAVIAHINKSSRFIYVIYIRMNIMVVSAFFFTLKRGSVMNAHFPFDIVLP